MAVSTPAQAQQLDSMRLNNSMCTQVTTVSPMQLGTDYWDLGLGECFFYPKTFLGVVDLPPYSPSLPLSMPASPDIYLSTPLQNPLGQNGTLDRLLSDSTIPQLIDVFLERLQQSMPFFTRSFLLQNIASQRHVHDRSFGSLVQAICSLVLLQPVQSQEKRPWPNREARADAHLALAVNLHSQADLGQSPTLETIMTSVFLFACQFCKGNYDAARFRLREAAVLAEVMNLDKPESYGQIGDTEKQRRLRTLISLTIIERIYSVQRDYIPGTKLLSRNKLQELQNAIASSDDRGESENIIAMEGISSMLEQVDFIDPDIIKCWKGFCWGEESPTHVTRSTILTLLRRYRIPPQFSGPSGIDTHAQHADILVTRHWMRIKLWSLASSHGYVEGLSDDEEFRNEYALTIASEALDTCFQFEMTSLEVHGVGLVEKLSDIATCAALQVNESCAALSPNQEYSIHADLRDPNTNGILPQEDSPNSRSSSGHVINGAEEMLNGYLSLFASFRRGKHPFLKPHREAPKTLVPIVERTATVVGSAPAAPALEFPSVFDPTMFFGNVASHSSVDTGFPIAAFSQTIASTSLPAFSPQTLFGGTGNEVPRALPLRERYIESFYLNFYAAHPFIPPKDLLLILAQQTSLEPLLAAMRWIGSLYIEQDSSRSLLTDASRLIDGTPLKNGFLVQAMLLVIIGLDGNRQGKRAKKLMANARDISIQIKLNTHPFAATNGQGIPILEESWRRTWWELYIVDALMSGVHQTNIFILYDVPTDVGLPCEEYQYLTGQIPPPIYPYDTENLGLFDGRPFSSYTYRIQCACLLGTLQKMPTQVDHVDRLLANWMLRLPPSKYDAYCKGELDEMMFQAIMMWQAISILLHQPHSQLDPSLTYNIKACVPNTPAVSSDALNSHTKHTIRAARELSKLISQRVPLLKHTHFFAYMVTLSSTIHLSRWSLTFVAEDDEDLRQNMGRNIGALIKYAEMWPMAQRLGLQVKQIAKKVYTTKKHQQQQPSK
ncbi:hypothetical protein QSH57_004095 [Fusarium oxysporum f. sp. vasinfectum]|nr:hypothetical protein QSH57_004095 [Fusarium oxysporum f. sp. vasinfectum]